MPISTIYEQLQQLALTDYGDIVLAAEIFLHSTGDVHKLRLQLLDTSIIDIFLSVSGRYSYHWDRRPAGKPEIYRHDNAPHIVWQKVETFPRHFHNGQEDQVVASYLSQDSVEVVREFCAFARKKLLDEVISQPTEKP